MPVFTEADVDGIKEAFEFAHEAFRDIQGRPECSVFKIEYIDGARGGDGSAFGITIDVINQITEWDMRQLTKVGAMSQEVPAYDITFEFHYGYVIPDKGSGYFIAVGVWLDETETMDSTAHYGPLCPTCLGEGTHETEYWVNAFGDDHQCNHCGGIGLDVYDERVKVYKILRERPDERMREVVYECYGVQNVHKVISNIVHQTISPGDVSPGVPDDVFEQEILEEGATLIHDDSEIHTNDPSSWLVDWLNDPTMDVPPFKKD
jgi:hypothetical protein